MVPPQEHGSADDLAHAIARNFAALPQVEAVAISGSRSSHAHDESSDIDLYVYVTSPIPLDARRKISRNARIAEIGNDFWEPGDEWIDAATSIAVDVMYRDLRWIESQIDRVLVQHQASVGYTTCFWYNVLDSTALFDRNRWFARLQQRCQTPYPEELQRAILAKNYPVLRRNQSSYTHQISLAVQRGDAISVQHRITALLASYFDILFAVNRQPHPGEKRLLWHARRLCPTLPLEMELDLRSLLASPQDDLLTHVDRLIDRLDEWLASAMPGFKLPSSR